jgi:hypothetical protein
MSNLHSDETQPRACKGGNGHESNVEFFDAKVEQVGEDLQIRRAIPRRGRRLVGPWCFLDHFGPVDVGVSDRPMNVAPHPHMGLQTVTWLIEGEVRHKDSLGYDQLIKPNQLNVMTSGYGLSHSEETPDEHSGRLHGVQLWTALPDSDRNGEPMFEHFERLPRLTRGDIELTVLAGEYGGEQSPATFFSPIIGLDLDILDDGAHELALEPDFEHGVLVLDGTVDVGGESVGPGRLAYMPPGQETLRIHTDEPARAFLVGGAPFGEEILMFWNFVGRNPDEIREAIDLWNAQDEMFGHVDGWAGKWLRSPEWGK